MISNRRIAEKFKLSKEDFLAEKGDKGNFTGVIKYEGKCYNLHIKENLEIVKNLMK
jgi:hypothetical protein